MPLAVPLSRATVVKSHSVRARLIETKVLLYIQIDATARGNIYIQLVLSLFNWTQSRNKRRKMSSLI